MKLKQFKTAKKQIRWDLILLINGAFLLIAVAVWGLAKPADALTGVGDEVECWTANPITSTYGNLGFDNNDAQGQVFPLTASVTISAIKVNMYIWTGVDGDPINFHITNVSGGTPAEPDMNSILGTELYDTSALQVYDQVTFSNNNFSCDPDVDSEQVIIFDPPIVVSAGTYAFVIAANGGENANDMILPYQCCGFLQNPIPDPYYYWECNVPTACTVLTPSTWDLAADDVTGIAIFSNIVTPGSTNFDAWLTAFLNQLGLNSLFGKAFFAAAVGGMFMFALLYRGAPPLIALAIGGMVSLPFVLIEFIPPEIFLTGFAVIGIAILFGFVRGFKSGGETS